MQPKEKIEGNLHELQQAAFLNSPAAPSSDPTHWSAFGEAKLQTMPKNIHPKSVRMIRGNNSNYNTTKQPGAGSTSEPWGFNQSNFKVDSFTSEVPKASGGNISQRFSGAKSAETKQPSGWTGF